MTWWLDLYWTEMRIAVMSQIQYRAATYFYMIGMVAEPVIYLVVWSTIARSHGGSVAGYTPGLFAAYYIVWTLVRNMNIVFTPYGWEWRIQRGQFSALLARPVHPIHQDIASFAGGKLVWMALWVPIAAILVLIFRPVIAPTPLEIVVFFIAIWGAYLIRTMFMWALGLIAFWTTRVSAIYQTYFAAELVLSGRLVPLALMPLWVRHIADFLPFQWTFGYPIEALIGTLSTRDLLIGLGVQAFWIALGTALVAAFWRASMRRYTAVGN